MTSITHKLRSTLAALCLVACNGSFGDATDTSEETGGGSGNTSSNSNSNSGGDEWAPCSAANACPDGQFCFNGICALGCTNDGDCADNQYCATDGDMLCHNKEVTTCPDVACPQGQECVNGLCSAPPADTQCEPSPVDDGCESNALCVEVEEGQPKCYSFPYCSQDGTCPVGTEGAVCNNDLLPDKDKICLTGLCTDVSHCPAEWFCVEFEPNSVLGFCSNGGFGNPCNSNAECLSGNCEMPFPDFAGTCL